MDKPHLFSSGIHFVTFTNYKWLPLLQITNSNDLVYKWFDVLQNNGHRVIGYVIMPNHLHALIVFNAKKQSLNTIVGNGKRFIAYGIVERLKATGQPDILETLKGGVTDSDRQRGKLHQVFEPSFDIKECRSLKFINQKLDYIHNNPVSKKWSLVKRPIDYIHSSAKFYETGVQSVYAVTNFMEFIDKDWNIVLAPGR